MKSSEKFWGKGRARAEASDRRAAAAPRDAPRKGRPGSRAEGAGTTPLMMAAGVAAPARVRKGPSLEPAGFDLIPGAPARVRKGRGHWGLGRGLRRRPGSRAEVRRE